MITVSEQASYGRPVESLQIRHRTKMKSEIVSSDVGLGARIGAGILGAIGLSGGALVSLGLVNIPGLMAAQDTVAALWMIVGALVAGMASGSVLGALMGGSIGLGVTEEQAVQYARSAHQGGVVIAVLSDWYTVDQAKEILNRYYPLDLREELVSTSSSGQKDGGRGSQTPVRKSQEQDERR